MLVHSLLSSVLNVVVKQVSSLRLLQLDRLEQRLEVTGSESLMVLSLDDLEEERRTILARLAEDLQEISVFVEVDQDVQFLQTVHVFFDSDRVLASKAFLQIVVVAGWNR